MPAKGYTTSEFYIVAGVIASILGNAGVTLSPTVKGILVSVLAAVYAGYRTFLKAKGTPPVSPPAPPSA